MPTAVYTTPPARTTWISHADTPPIHDDILDMVTAKVPTDSGAVLDLCLEDQPHPTRRLSEAGYDVVAAVIKRPRLEDDRVGDLLGFIKREKVRTVVARRILPELSDMLGEDRYDAFVRALVEAGVERLVSEGRAVSVRTTHPLGTPEAEWKSLRPTWRVKHRKDAVALLVPGGRKAK